MSTTLMLVLAAATVLLPLVLMVAFNKGDEADAHGRRISRRWHT